MKVGALEEDIKHLKADRDQLQKENDHLRKEIENLQVQLRNQNIKQEIYHNGQHPMEMATQPMTPTLLVQSPVFAIATSCASQQQFQFPVATAKVN